MRQLYYYFLTTFKYEIKQGFVLGIFCGLLLIACAPIHKQFENAAQTGRAEPLRAFLQENPNSKYLDKAQQLIANIELKKARVQNTEQAYQNIINDNPGNNQIYRLASIKIENLNYSKAREKNTIEAYKAFIKKFPFGKSRAAAQSHIESLLFNQVKQNNDEQSLIKYLKTAKHNKDDIKQAKKSLEKLAFDKVVTINSVEAYQKFIVEHENSIYAIKATERLLNLRLPSTVYLSNKGHVSIQQGKITSLSDNKLIATYGKTAKQEFIFNKNTPVCSKSKKKLSYTKLASNQDISIATLPENNKNTVLAIYLGNTTVKVNKNDNSDNQPTFINFPECFPPATKP